MPLRKGKDGVVNQVGCQWVPESGRFGQRSVWVHQLSVLSTLKQIFANTKQLLTGAYDLVKAKGCIRLTMALIVKCFKGQGVKFLSSGVAGWIRSEEHTSELQSLMRISYAVFCLKKKQKQ